MNAKSLMVLVLMLSLSVLSLKSAELPETYGPMRGPSTLVPRSSPIFVFHSDEFWLNLHHFLYVLGRAENKTRDSSREAVAGAPTDQQNGLVTLKPKEQAIRERDTLEEIWKPYLDGHGTRDDAFAELIKRLAPQPNGKPPL